MLELTDLANRQTDKKLLNPSLILEIEGYDKIFSLSNVFKRISVGDTGLYIGDSWLIGGDTENYQDAYSFISTDGTTSSINQQLLQDKGGTSSVSSIQISLIDKSEIVTDLVSPSFVLDDILGRRAWVHLGFAGTRYPDDHVILFSGIIDDVSASGASIKLNVAHPEQLKRQDVFVKVETSLDGAINSSQTSITLSDASNLLTPVSGFETYVKINDEIIRYTGITTNTLTGCTRAQFGTIAASADDDDSVESFYRLQGSALDLALKILLSGENDYWATINANYFNQDSSGTAYTNAIFISGVDVKKKWGLTVGDFVTTTGATLAANNFTLRTVTDISVDYNGSLITIDGAALATESGSGAEISFKSRYNVLPDGLNMGGDQVDVAEFERLQDLFIGQIHTYDFYLKETMKGREFVDGEVLFPSNFFSLPRKGRVSCGAVAPPLAVGSLPRIDASNLVNPSQVVIRRTIGKYFYNTTVYKYNFDAVDDKPLTGFITVDEDSKNRIQVGTKAITIVSNGLRNNNATTTILDINSRRFLDRYKYAAEEIRISVFYGVGFKIDVGDIVYFGDLELGLLDSKRGKRGFLPRLCEVVDKKMNIFTGKVDLTLVDTAYSAEGRYGIFSPSSIVGTGSTTSTIKITTSYNTVFPDIERDKWENYIGQAIRIHTTDWATSYDSTLLGFADDTTMIIAPIAASVTAGYLVNIANYDSGSDPDVNFYEKNIHCFANPSVSITGGTSSTVFDVSSTATLLVGATVQVRNADWSVISPDVRIEEINGLQIVVSASLGFTPTSDYKLEGIGFLDRGSFYRYL